ncbi:hypothetical protein RHIZ404_190094 [Rhizobium sp. EC-SD404]|nr:hypothetical protein RHIZ404_190094 [Rhizobium sp. EC-SD404]
MVLDVILCTDAIFMSAKSALCFYIGQDLTN